MSSSDRRASPRILALLLACFALAGCGFRPLYATGDETAEFDEQLASVQVMPISERIAYVPELASVQLAGLKNLVLVDAKAPAGQHGYVEYAWKGIKGRARVRVLSPLPIAPLRQRHEQS